jgi:hypothetical protein
VKSGLAWEGKPTLRVSPSGARVVIGTVRNGSSRELRIKSPEVTAVDGQGRRIKSSAGFVSTFVRSLYPQNGRPGDTRDEFPEAEQRRIGYLAVMAPGESVPLTVSWNEPSGRTATRIRIGQRYLPVPTSPTG